MGVIFIAGIYCVGKSTICKKIKEKYSIKDYNASDLISFVNKESYGATKVVKDKNMNQKILISEVEKLLKNEDRILLSGHFCIKNKNEDVDILPMDTYRHLNIEIIFVLTRPILKIQEELKRRDSKEYSLEFLKNMQNTEIECAKKVAELIDRPIKIIEMMFDETDINKFDVIGKEDYNNGF